jgi:hypothetical protein
MIQDSVQTIKVGQEHVGAFVRGKASCESDHQGRGIDFRKEFFPPRLRITIFHPVFGQIFPQKIDGLLLELISRVPQQ